MQTSITDIAKENQELQVQNKILQQQIMEQSVPPSPPPAPTNTQHTIDPDLFKELISATQAQTNKIRTACTNQEQKALQKTQKNNTFS